MSQGAAAILWALRAATAAAAAKWSIRPILLQAVTMVASRSSSRCPSRRRMADRRSVHRTAVRGMPLLFMVGSCLLLTVVLLMVMLMVMVVAVVAVAMLSLLLLPVPYGKLSMCSMYEGTKRIRREGTLELRSRHKLMLQSKSKRQLRQQQCRRRNRKRKWRPRSLPIPSGWEAEEAAMAATNASLAAAAAAPPPLGLARPVLTAATTRGPRGRRRLRKVRAEAPPKRGDLSPLSSSSSR
mmetsp:Transcript_31979/g.70266  ORF Transcript_31979/g.70266 Transcript_31979/m.70266 type:complete len:240 (+) Transcript_31979:3-722(+)